MCGIAGRWGSADVEADVQAMMSALVHRGPDAEGIFVQSTGMGWLGHRRLSIVDPAGGDQPIVARGGDLAIVANGEIYNAPDLRPSLTPHHRFVTESDTEVLLHVYDDHGARAVEHVDGMYAFAIADGDQIFLARDPIGIKPLYYQQSGDTLRFASELKAFPAGTEDVREFPPGTVYSSAGGFSTFYTVPDPAPLEDTVKAHARRVREVLQDAVVKRLMSDVPVGAFLSGGLDSSTIAAVARPHVQELHTFSVGTEGSHDLEAARLVARHLDTKHHEHVLTPDEVAMHLPRIIFALESFDQDLVRSAIPTYFAARLAAQHVKVILTGEGADELFAGYRYHRGIADDHRLRHELRRSVTALHNLNLQRVDRMTMAHSLEGRVPFLDLEMIEVALAIPAQLKLPTRSTRRMAEKWILRAAVEDLLPPEVTWRDKEQFDEGSGAVDLLAAFIEELTDGLNASSYRRRHPEVWLRSAEECHYHQLLLEAFGARDLLMSNIGRWADRRDDSPSPERRADWSSQADR
ncbi:MAG: asparagine synthase B [Egibacteraceae bacterium]